MLQRSSPLGKPQWTDDVKGRCRLGGPGHNSTLELESRRATVQSSTFRLFFFCDHLDCTFLSQNKISQFLRAGRIFLHPQLLQQSRNVT